MNKIFKTYFKNIDAILISSLANIIYLIGNFEFSQSERECFILITKNKKYVITDPRYSESIKKQALDFEIIELGTGFFINKFSKLFFAENNIKRLGIEINNITVAEYSGLKKSAKLISVDLADLRTIKRADEIKNIKHACKIGDEAFKYILSKFKLGVSEKEISECLISFFKTKNADYSFKPIVAFGKNSAIPHHISDKTKLKKDQIILLDFGVKVNNYCSDMSRTIFFGKINIKFRKMHDTTLNAQKKAIESIKNNIEASIIDKTAREFIIKQNFPNIIHAVGHGIGIEIHEKPYISPNSKDKIKDGMIFSIEPGIYINNYGGVRIEDLVLIQDGNAELISHAKREIIEINDK